MERLSGLADKIKDALERIWGTVAARVNQAASKSTDMGQQPGMGPG